MCGFESHRGHQVTNYPGVAEMDSKIRSYAPDFYLPDFDVYLEIKGYWWGRDKEKMDLVIAQNPCKRICIITKSEFDRLMQGELVWS